MLVFELKVEAIGVAKLLPSLCAERRPPNCIISEVKCCIGKRRTMGASPLKACSKFSSDTIKKMPGVFGA